MTVDEVPSEVAHFGTDSESAGGARRFVSTTLGAWGCEALEDIATLLVSELVANVVLHAGTELDVVVRKSEGSLRIEVHDHSPRLPTRKHYSLTATTGRGLRLVEDLAKDWGAETTPDGKFVWFELDENAPPAGPALMGAFGLDDWDDLSELELETPSRAIPASEEGGGQEPPAAGRPLALADRS